MSQPVTKHNSSPKLTFAEELPPYLDKLVQTVGISTDIARILKQLGEERAKSKAAEQLYAALQTLAKSNIVPPAAAIDIRAILAVIFRRMNHPRDSKWFRDAPTNGLADSVKTIEEIIQEIKEDAANSTNPAHVSKVLPAEVSQSSSMTTTEPMMGIFIGGKVKAKGQVGIYIDPSVSKETREEFQNSKSVIKITGDINAGHGIGTYNVTSVKNIHLDLGQGDKETDGHLGMAFSGQQDASAAA